MALAILALAAAVPPAVQAQSGPGLLELVPAARAAGRGRLRFWGLDVYDASLAVSPGFRAGEFASHGFALQLQYLRAFSGADIAQRSLEEMRRSGGFPEARAQQWQSALAGVLPDVRAGDRLTGVNRPGQPVLLLFNGRTLGEVGDAQFARLFFGIWLGSESSEPALRNALLAGTTP